MLHFDDLSLRRGVKLREREGAETVLRAAVVILPGA